MPSNPPKGLGPFTQSVRDLLEEVYPALPTAEMHIAFADVVGGEHKSKGNTAAFADAIRRLLQDHAPLGPNAVTNALGAIAEEMAQLEASGVRSLARQIQRSSSRDLRDDRWTFEQYWKPTASHLVLRFPDEEHMGRFCERLVREQTFECHLDNPPQEFSAISLNIGVVGVELEVIVAAGIVRVKPDNTVLCAIQHVPAGIRRSAARRRARLSQNVMAVSGTSTPTGQTDVIRSAFTTERDTLTPIGDFANVPTGGHQVVTTNVTNRDRSALRKRGRSRHAASYRGTDIEDELTRFGRMSGQRRAPELDSLQHVAEQLTSHEVRSEARRAEPTSPFDQSDTQPVARLRDTQSSGHYMAADSSRHTPIASRAVGATIVSRASGAHPLGGPPALLLRAANLHAVSILDLTTPTGRWCFTIASGALETARPFPGSRPLLLDADGGVASLRAVLGDEVVAFDISAYEPRATQRRGHGPVVPQAWAWLRDVCLRMDTIEVERVLARHLPHHANLADGAEDLIDALPFTSIEADFIELLSVGMTLETSMEQSGMPEVRSRALALAMERGGLLSWRTPRTRESRINDAWLWIATKLRDVESGNPFDLLEAHWASDASLIRHACDTTLRTLDLDFVAAEGNSMQRSVATRVRDALIAARDRLHDPLERTNERRKLVTEDHLAHSLQLFESQAESALRESNNAMAIDSLRRVVELAPNRRSARAQLDALTSTRRVTTGTE